MQKLIIILASLIELEEHKLLEILRKYQEAIAWSIEDLKGIGPFICNIKSSWRITQIHLLNIKED